MRTVFDSDFAVSACKRHWRKKGQENIQAREGLLPTPDEKTFATLSCTVAYMFPYMCCKRTLMHPHADIHTSHSHTCRCKDIHRVPDCIQTLPIPQAVRTLQLSPCNYTERKQALQRLTNGTFIKNSYMLCYLTQRRRTRGD